MTGDEFIQKQKKLLLNAQEKAFKTAVFDSHRNMGNRIFVGGLDSFDKRIGSYNTTNPIYINPLNSPRKFTTGKFENGNQRKTKRFDSYRDFRSAVGRKVDRVNLNLFGNLQNDFVSGLRKVSKTYYESVLKRPEDLAKVNGAEKRFNTTIFSLSKKEREEFFITMEKETFLILKGNA